MDRDAVVGREVSAARVPHVGQVQLVHAPLICVRHVAVLEHVPDVLQANFDCLIASSINRLLYTRGFRQMHRRVIVYIY